MVMWKFKSCPRCGGDTFIDKDMYGWYEQCLQCSHRCDLPKEASRVSRAAGHAEEDKLSDASVLAGGALV